MLGKKRWMKMERISKIEHALLVGLIDSHREILDVKNTDAVSNAAKVKAWISIENLYNSHEFVIKRNWRQLRKAWENIKCKRKRMLTQNLRYWMKAGGGPCTSTSTDVFPETVIAPPSLVKTHPAIEDTNHMITPTPGEMKYELLDDNEQLISDEEQPPVACLLTPGERRPTSSLLNPGECQLVNCCASPDGELQMRVESEKSLKEIDNDIYLIRKRTAEMELKLKEIEVSKAERLKEVEVTKAENSLRHQQRLMDLELRERKRHYQHLEEMRKRESSSLHQTSVP